jgi:hypothetical protein
MILHTTHWSRDGKLHRGTVENCESCRVGAGRADPGTEPPNQPGRNDHAQHRC